MPDWLLTNLGILLAAFAIPIVIMLIAYLVSRKRARQLGAQLRVAEGNAIIRQETSSRGGMSYVVKVGAKKFNFFEEHGRLFKQGAAYRIYYAKAGPYEPTLSIEEVEQ